MRSQEFDFHGKKPRSNEEEHKVGQESGEEETAVLQHYGAALMQN